MGRRLPARPAAAPAAAQAQAVKLFVGERTGERAFRPSGAATTTKAPTTPAGSGRSGLQSSNEELETSKVEMQSLNEELSAVASQLRSEMEEHEAARNDLTALLSSTDIAALFLDMRFRIRRFTPPVKKLLEMISSDVGRPLANLARKFRAL